MADSSRLHRSRPDRRPHSARRGGILIIAMIVIFAMAAMVLTLGQAMRVESTVAANSNAARQAGLVARGAEQYVLALLANAVDEPVETLEESFFEAIVVGDGYFWIVRPDYQDTSLPQFGFVDESAKLDLNGIGYERLRTLPGMTDELAASIVDWRDEDETLTAGLGAESQVYLGRTPSYMAKNQPFEFVEELLLVDGMTPELLWGEPQQPAGAGLDSRLFQSEHYRIHGMFDWFTAWGTPASGEGPRLEVNNLQFREQLRQLLNEVFGASRGEEMGSRLPPGPVLDIFDFAQRLGMDVDELRDIEPRINVSPAASGRLNVNAAPRELLLSVPELNEADVDALLSRRAGQFQTDPHSIAWVMEVLPEKAIGLGQRLVGAGRFYSADIVAVAGNGRAFRRVRIVVDSESAPPAIVYRRDITDRGWPLDASILQSLRAGEGLIGGGWR